jgi:hypothetical protein
MTGMGSPYSVIETRSPAWTAARRTAGRVRGSQKRAPVPVLWNERGSVSLPEFEVWAESKRMLLDSAN